MPFPTFFIINTLTYVSKFCAGDIYFQLVLKNITFCFVQYVIDRFENHPPSVGFRIGFAYPILIEWRITDSNR